MKTCSKCKESKPLEMFSKERNRKSGIRAACRACDARRCSAYRAANKEKIAAYNGARWSDPRARAAQTVRVAAWTAKNRDWKSWCNSQSRMLRGG